MGRFKLKRNKFKQDKFVLVICHGFDIILNAIKYKKYYSKNATKM